jgi:hypothetical protein
MRVADRSRYPKVCDFDAAVFRHHDVAGLQVAVDDLLLVDKLEHVANLPHPADQRLFRVKAAIRLFGLLLSECRSIHILHCDRRQSLGGIFVEIVYSDDSNVREFEAAGNLFPQIVQSFRIRGNHAGQEFERDFEPEPLIVREPDHAHAAFSELTDEPEPAEDYSGRPSIP